MNIMSEKYIEEKNIFFLLNIIIYKRKYFTIIIILFLYYFEIYFKHIENYKHDKIIFTFWEPKEKLPGYLNLCIKTWKMFLSDYEIKILDYKTLKEYIGEELFSNIICKNMPLHVQADAIRVSLLKLYGGLWLDTDTIVLNGNFTKEFERYELTMIGEEKIHYQYIGFILASKNSSILNNWFNNIIYKVKNYKYILNRNKSNLTEKMKNFDYLGNSIIDPILNNISNNTYFRIDSQRIKAFPERIIIKNSSLTNSGKYRKFYFTKGNPQIIFNTSKYIILLHNTWTPLIYKNMTEEEFLSQDILISKLLSLILNKNLSNINNK